MVSKNRSKIDDLSRKKVLERLSRIQFGKIEIIEDENTLSFGEGNSSFEAKIIINDYKFYSELVFGGSIGAAEAFMMKYWDTNDLTIIVRILLQNRSILDEFDSGFGSIMKPLRKLAHWLQRNTRKGSQKNISAHYDLGNDFFETWLDSKMMYSCAIFKKKDSSLEEASTLKIDRICKKLNLKESDHLLEIGTGWGGFAIYAAKNYGCKVTSTTISKEQHQMAKLRVEGHNSLIRDTLSKAVVNSSTSEYKIYKSKYRAREQQSDELRTACKEINNLKAELREIKDLIKKVIEK